MKLKFFAAVVLLLSITGCLSSNHSEKQFRSVGYLPWYRFSKVEVENLRGLTHVILFSLEADSNGYLCEEELRRRGNPSQIAAALRQKGISPIIGIGGWGNKVPFRDIVADNQKRSRLVTQLSQFCRYNGFDGVDFDWEFPKTTAEKRGYAKLIEETAAVVGSVSVAMSPKKDFGSAYLHRKVFNIVDWVGIMSYDAGGRHSEYEDSISHVDWFLSIGVPREKLLLGLPFYARNIKKFSSTRTYGYIANENELLAFEQDHHYEKNGSSEPAVFFFNGRNTILRKAEFAKKFGLGGVMIWEIGQDSQDYEKSLLYNLADFIESE